MHTWLLGKMSVVSTQVVEMILVGTVFLLFFALLGLVLVYAERKVCAIIQVRLGPMRVGKWGTAQTLADFIKLVFKEPLITRDADKFFITN